MKTETSDVFSDIMLAREPRGTMEVGGLECEIPGLPNYLRTAKHDVPIPVRGLSEKELRKIGRAWTNALIERSRRHGWIE